MNNNLNSIANNIKKCREDKRLTQKELGDLLHKSWRHTRKIETSDCPTSTSTLSDISNALQVPLDVLLKDCDKEFLVHAIDDYLNLIDREKSLSLLNELLTIIGKDSNENNT